MKKYTVLWPLFLVVALFTVIPSNLSALSDKDEKLLNLLEEKLAKKVTLSKTDQRHYDALRAAKDAEESFMYAPPQHPGSSSESFKDNSWLIPVDEPPPLLAPPPEHYNYSGNTTQAMPLITKPKTVIIPPFDLTGGATLMERDTITRFFMGDLANKRVFRVADRGSVEARIAETDWQMSDYSNNAKTAKLNEGINADYLIIGTIAKMGNSTTIDAMLEDLNTFEVIGNARIRMNNTDEAFDLMESFVTNLVRNVSSYTNE